MGPVFAEFRGERAVVAPLTWGQQAMWRLIRLIAPADGWLNQLRCLAGFRRATLGPAAVAVAIGRLVSRHEALRTRIREVDGEVCQVVADRGRVPVEVVSAAPADADDAGRELAQRLVQPAFDHADDLPIRVGVVTVDGRVTCIALVLSHMCADWFAADLVERELRILLLHQAVNAPRGVQPVDLAYRQRAVQRPQSDRALAYWLAQYQRIPPGMFARVDGARDASTPSRYQRMYLTSAALPAAAALLAARHRVTTSTVLLTATAARIGEWTGQPVCGLMTMVNNRFQPGHAQVVSSMNQLGLFVLDVGPGGADLDELIPRAWRAALLAYRNGYYDVADHEAAVQAAGRTSGIEADPFCCFSDVRLTSSGGTIPGPSGPDGPPDAGQLPAALQHSALSVEPVDEFNWQFYLEVRDAPGALCLVLVSDTRYLPADHAERFLRGLERNVVDAALTPSRGGSVR
jgi:Condensation domain